MRGIGIYCYVCNACSPYRVTSDGGGLIVQRDTGSRLCGKSFFQRGGIMYESHFQKIHLLV